MNQYIFKAERMGFSIWNKSDTGSIKGKKCFAGYHPRNEPSCKLLIKLGFRAFTTGFYEPTGLVRPLYSYFLVV